MKPKQITLFDSPILATKTQAESQNLTYEELWAKFKAEYESARLYPGNPLFVEFPATEAIAEMGRKQVKRYRTSHRLRQDCDRISLLGKMAWSKYMGEPAHVVFDAWHDALGKGNKGIFWSIPGENIGLRTTGGTKGDFIYSRNKHEGWITAMAFARIQTQHNGSAYVELLGWAHKNRIAGFIKDRGQILQIKIKHVQTAGLLLTPEDLKDRYVDSLEVE